MYRNMKFQLLLLLIFAGVLTSCTTTKTITTKSMDIYGPGVIQNPVVVDLKVDETKVFGTATESQSNTLLSVKQKALIDAMKKSGADVIVEPVFETETKKGKTTATVSGYPAVYTNFRPIEAEDF